MHPDGRFDVRSQGARGVPEPPLTLRQPPLGDHRPAEHRVGHGDERLVAPAVLPGQLDRLPAALRSARVGPQGGEFRPVRQGGELEIRPPDPARQSHALLQVLVCVLETERPDFGDAEADQRQRSQVLAQAELRSVRRVDGGQQPVRRLRHRRQVPALPGQVQPQDRKHDLQASAPVRRVPTRTAGWPAQAAVLPPPAIPGPVRPPPSARSSSASAAATPAGNAVSSSRAVAASPPRSRSTQWSDSRHAARLQSCAAWA